MPADAVKAISSTFVAMASARGRPLARSCRLSCIASASSWEPDSMIVAGTGGNRAHDGKVSKREGWRHRSMHARIITSPVARSELIIGWTTEKAR